MTDDASKETGMTEEWCINMAKREAVEKPKMTDEQIKQMAERFLTWELPDDFCPDGGVAFKRVTNEGTLHEHIFRPVGTNLLTYTQAEAMVQHMLDQPAGDK